MASGLPTVTTPPVLHWGSAGRKALDASGKRAVKVLFSSAFSPVLRGTTRKRKYGRLGECVIRLRVVRRLLVSLLAALGHCYKGQRDEGAGHGGKV